MGYTMKALLAVLAVSSALAGATTLSGQVAAPDQKPLAGARVFVEQGLSGPIRETRADNNGVFHFSDLPPGMTGLFAIADGFAFGGLSVDVVASQGTVGLIIPLRKNESITGVIVGPKKNPVSGARVTRVVLLNEPHSGHPKARNKVGIPIAKLGALGFDVPISLRDGAFRIPRLPAGSTVAVKVAHPRFAQEGVLGLHAGQTGVTITLNPGIVIEGTVAMRDTGTPVANASVSIRSDQPPHETSLAKSDGLGNFVVRIKPGVYACQATSPRLRSPGWSKLAVTGEHATQRLRILVARSGLIRGRVTDAVTGKPIPGAKLTLNSYGNPAAISHTDKHGAYEMPGVEGDNLVTLVSAEGFLPPEKNRLHLKLSPGESFDVPTFWLMPTPKYAVSVLDPALQPTPGAIVSAIRPAQFGWRAADAQGIVPLGFGALPADGRVLGLAEHPTKPLGALFALSPKDIPLAKVQLLPLATVRGRIVSPKGKGIPGVVVGLAFAKDAPGTALLVARTVTRPDGSYEFPAVVPGINYRCAAHSTGGPIGATPPFEITPSETHLVAHMTAQPIKTAGSLFGATLPWKDQIATAAQSSPGTRKPRATVVLCCKDDQAMMIIEGLAQAQRLLSDQDIQFAAVVSGPLPSAAVSIPVLKGTAPGVATTYVANAQGEIIMETFGMPPLAALQSTEPSP
jgi:carboxypeptidase family protein